MHINFVNHMNLFVTAQKKQTVFRDSALGVNKDRVAIKTEVDILTDIS